MADDIRALSEELARSPQSLAFIPLAEALRRQGQLDHALKIVLRGLERHPHVPDAHDLLARIYADEGETQKAFDEWDMALRLAPDHTGAAKGMGLICFNDGRIADAERYLQAAMAAAPDDESIASALAFVRGSATGDLGAGGRNGAQAAPAVTPPVPEAAAAPEAGTGDAGTGAELPPEPDAGDPRFLFATVLGDDDQTALLLDGGGLVLAGAYHTWEGRDIAQEIGAELSGVSDEATRATRHLGVGAWRSIVFETEAATVAMAPAADDGLLVLAVGTSTPLGLTRRLLERCAARARMWLEGVA